MLLRLSALIAALALLFAACGDDDSTTADDTTVTETLTDETSPPEATTVLAPTSVPPTTADPAVDGCDHAYFPAGTGTSWTYETLDDEEITWVIESTGPDGTGAVMEAELDSPEGLVEMTINITCDEAGMSAPEFGFVGLPFGFEVQSVLAEGVTLAPADQLVEDAMWDSLIEIEASTQGIEVLITRKTTYKVIGFEEVETDAGPFQAVRIRSEFELDINMGGAPITSQGATDTWFAEGVGIVKEEEYRPDGGTPSYGLLLTDFAAG